MKCYPTETTFFLSVRPFVHFSVMDVALTNKMQLHMMSSLSADLLKRGSLPCSCTK